MAWPLTRSSPTRSAMGVPPVRLVRIHSFRSAPSPSGSQSMGMPSPLQCSVSGLRAGKEGGRESAKGGPWVDDCVDDPVYTALVCLHRVHGCSVLLIVVACVESNRMRTCWRRCSCRMRRSRSGARRWPTWPWCAAPSRRRSSCSRPAGPTAPVASEAHEGQTSRGMDVEGDGV